MKKQNHATQQFKNSARNSFASLHESENLVRDAQSLLRRLKTIGAPRLNPRELSRGIYLALKHRTPAMLAIEFRNVTRWASFWTAMFFRWLYDELTIIFHHFIMTTLIALGYVVGIILAVMLFYFILTY